MDLFAVAESWPAVVLGQIPGASNDTFLCLLTPPAGPSIKAVYKPEAGESPLRDFTELARREVAASRLSDLTGLACVPPTVMRTDLPFGPGSVQLYVDSTETQAVDVWEHDEIPAGILPIIAVTNEEGTPMVVGHGQDEGIANIAVFDILANNADRKGSHVLHGRLPTATGDSTFWAIDNGLTFHTEEKLRTVLWGFSGRALSDHQLTACAAVDSVSGDDLGLYKEETHALKARARHLLDTGTFPPPPTDRYPTPWPLL